MAKKIEEVEKPSRKDRDREGDKDRDRDRESNGRRESVAGRVIMVSRATPPPPKAPPVPALYTELAMSSVHKSPGTLRDPSLSPDVGVDTVPDVGSSGPEDVDGTARYSAHAQMFHSLSDLESVWILHADGYASCRGMSA